MERDPNILRRQKMSASRKADLPTSRQNNSEKFTSLLARRALQKQGCFHVKETYGYGKRPMYMEADLLISQAKSPDTARLMRGGGLGSRPKKMYGERLGDGVEYHLMKPTPRR